MENSLLELASSLDLSDFTKEAIDHSLLYSEIDGSLSVEGISIPQKRMVELIQEDAEPINRNDLIVKNTAKGNDFVLAKPPFDERNLTHLYALLSNGCLDDEVQLLTGNLYRHDEVEIDHDQGYPHEKIKECMDSLFAFVNENLKNPKLKFFLPHIAHYYLLYVHPYFDYNGRTARMVSLWLYFLTGNVYPSFISEGIDLKKDCLAYLMSNFRE